MNIFGSSDEIIQNAVMQYKSEHLSPWHETLLSLCERTLRLYIERFRR